MGTAGGGAATARVTVAVPESGALTGEGSGFSGARGDWASCSRFKGKGKARGDNDKMSLP